MHPGKTRSLVWLVAVAAFGAAAPLAAQDPPPTTRTEVIEQAKADKSADLKPFEPNRVEQGFDRVEDIFLSGRLHVHPFFDNAYAGGGFTLGAGYITHVRSYNTLDVRGSFTFLGYTRLEAQFLAPRLFKRRGVLSVLGGWRNATQVGFYGIGTKNTSTSDQTNYSFTQPYLDTALQFWPTRRLLMLGGEVEVSQWNQGPGEGSAPSVDAVYTPETLPGLGASPIYVHSRGTVALDSRSGPGYSRRGGYYGITVHDYHDTRNQFGFNHVDYEAIQHLPVLREAWVLSLHGLVETTGTKSGQDIPFFMLPSVGGGSSLRGYSSWRFRDRNSVLVQAEWRIMVNRFIDTALFYDAGKVTSRSSDLSLNGLEDDYGFGIRLHGPIATPLRIDFAKSHEGFSIVFAASAAF